MGVTLSFKDRSIDLSGGDFYRLRSLIAGECSKRIKTLYQSAISIELSAGVNSAPYRQVREEIASEFKKVSVKRPDLIHSFLFMSDVKGRRSYRTCEAILDLIMDYPNDTRIGYVGRMDPTTMGGFKELLKACIEHKGYMILY